TWKQDIDNLNVGTGKKVEIKDRRFNLKIKNFKGELEETCLTSRSNDGQLMFMLHMLSKMKDPKDGGSRIASVHNGSALFTGDAGSSESGIRQYILENDLLEAVIALPLDIFYNTGQPTYVLILSNVKDSSRKGRVQLIKADSFFKKMTKGLGNKKNELTSEHINFIVEFYLNNEQNEFCKIFNNEEFGFYSLKVKHSIEDFEENIDFKDIEFIPLKYDVHKYISNEVLKYTPNAKVDFKSIKTGYSINFLEHFHQANSYRNLDAVIKDIQTLEEKSNGLLNILLR